MTAACYKSQQQVQINPWHTDKRLLRSWDTVMKFQQEKKKGIESWIDNYKTFTCWEHEQWSERKWDKSLLSVKSFPFPNLRVLRGKKRRDISPDISANKDIILFDKTCNFLSQPTFSPPQIVSPASLCNGMGGISSKISLIYYFL